MKKILIELINNKRRILNFLNNQKMMVKSQAVLMRIFKHSNLTQVIDIQDMVAEICSRLELLSNFLVEYGIK